MGLMFLPYYSEPARDPQEIRRNRAKRGTTRFHLDKSVGYLYPKKQPFISILPLPSVVTQKLPHYLYHDQS
jgi:hypothetical protein